MAIVDYIVFGQKLKYYHTLGTISIVACTVIISLAGVVDPPETTLIITSNVIVAPDSPNSIA